MAAHAFSARRLGEPRLNLRVVRRAACAEDASILTSSALHPVLRRIYLGRGVRTADDLDLSLERLRYL